jgi:CheY-like chemotaxis protein
MSARRAELLSALLQAKGIPAEQGMRAVQSALGAIAASAEAAQLTSLVALTRALQSALGHLGMTPPRTGDHRSLDVLVFDESEVSRDLVALAVEGQGHIVRSAHNYGEFIGRLNDQLPDLIVTEIELSNANARQFCAALKELLVDRPVPTIFFSSAAPEEIQEAARTVRPLASVHKADGIRSLIIELEYVLETL